MAGTGGFSGGAGLGPPQVAAPAPAAPRPAAPGIPRGSAAPGRGGARGGRGGARGGQRGGQRGGIAPNSPLLNPNAPLSGQALYQAAQGLARSQTQGPLSELAREIAQNNAQTAGAAKLTSGYFNQLGQYGVQGANMEGQIGSQLNQNLANLGTNEQQQLQGIGQNQMANMQTYSPGGDPSVTQAGSQALAQEIARQQGLSAQDMAGLQAGGATQGANYQGLAAANLGAYARAGQQALTGIEQGGQARNLPLNAKVAALNENYGALLGKDVTALRQQQIADQISAGALNVKGQSVATARQNDLANQRLKAAGINAADQRSANALAAANARNLRDNQTRLTIAQQRDALKQAALNLRAKGAGGGRKPLTANQNNAMTAMLAKAAAAAQGLKTTGATEAQIFQALTSGTARNNGVRIGSLNPVLVKAALSLQATGTITPQLAAAMHNMGMRQTTYGGKPISVKALVNDPGLASQIGLTGALGTMGAIIGQAGR